jgi:hypothetical protein
MFPGLLKMDNIHLDILDANLLESLYLNGYDT